MCIRDSEVAQQDLAEHIGRRPWTVAGGKPAKKAKPTGRVAVLAKEIDAREKKSAQQEQQEAEALDSDMEGEDEP
eukprot:14738991-Alexandrium_andersonii.AAC.1